MPQSYDPERKSRQKRKLGIFIISKNFQIFKKIVLRKWGFLNNYCKGKDLLDWSNIAGCSEEFNKFYFTIKFWIFNFPCIFVTFSTLTQKLQNMISLLHIFMLFVWKTLDEMRSWNIVDFLKSMKVVLLNIFS